MSSDNDQIPQSGKRKKLVIHDSEDSDDSVVQSRRRKKTYRVISEGESSDEDSDVQRPNFRRQNHRVITEDETRYEASSSCSNKYQCGESSQSPEWQSDWTSSSESEKCPVKRKVLGKSRAKNPPKIVSDTSDTDNSDDQLEKCPICLLPFRRQQLGIPSSCEHCFCLECLIEWSKNINTCPVDRQMFTTIHVRDELGGQIVKNIAVEVTPRVEDELEDPTFCEVCHQSDREDRMLLCDGCDCGYHLECLTPPMNEVPMEEWFCPECSQNSQDDAEAVEIDLDEISDLMEEARRLGVSYGRTRTGQPENSQPRIVPRTRHTERVRATIRRRNRVYDNIQQTRHLTLDPNQPTTSSGLESFGDNSRSRSPSNASNSLGSGDCSDRNFRYSRRSRRFRSSSSDTSDESVSTKPRQRTSDKKSNPRSSDNSKSKSSSRKRGSTLRKTSSRKKSARRPRKTGTRNRSRKSVRSRNVSGGGTLLREVRITECNQDGEEEEIVTFVKVASIGSRRKTKRRKRRKRRRQARTVSSVLASSKQRLAVSLGICKPVKNVPALLPSVRSRTVLSERSSLNTARYNAGITQLSLLGNGLDLSYSPPGSDTEEYHGTVGPTITIHRRSVLSSRRHLRIKNIANPQQPQIDLLSSIINNQEIWHSKNNDVTLKADGLLLTVKRDSVDHVKKEKVEEKKSSETEETGSPVEDRVSATGVPLEVSGINPELITQAPMYNNPCGGGNRGNFRGGYRDNTRHSHGGQNYGRDSLPGGGRHSYGGSGGNFGRDFGPPAFYNPNFEHCGPPMFGGNPPFRNRNPQHFRNERFRFMPPGRPPFNFGEGFDHHSFPERFNRPRSPQPPVERPQNSMPANLPEDTPGTQTAEQQPQDAENPSVRQEEDCDIYCDIETKSDGELQDQQNGSMALLPPPEPPSGLLDFEENSRSDKDSDQELVIDDSQKDDTPKNDKYDPFSVDSDSDSEVKKNDVAEEEAEEEKKEEETLESVTPPEPPDTSIRLSAYEDEDEEDSQSDCPNFSIYSSQTMDVARHTEQQLSQQIGPLEPPPLPPSIPDDDDVIVGDVQACDLADIPEPSDPYVESLRKERQTLSKIPPKKISHDSRGKITFKIGTKLKINNRLLGLQEEEKESEDEKKKEPEQAKEEETSIDREEERKKIAKSKLEEEAQSEEDKAEIVEDTLISANTVDLTEEMDGNEEEMEKESADVSTADVTESNSNAAVSAGLTHLSPRKLGNDFSNECPSEASSDEGSDIFPSLAKTSKADVEEDSSKEALKIVEEPSEVKTKGFDDAESEKDEREQLRIGDADEEDDDDEEEDEDEEEEDDDENDEKERFPIEKETPEKKDAVEESGDRNNWESDGAYTPCKDELPLKESKSFSEQLPSIESGLEPITPTKDKADDLDSCRTPVDYNVLGTEAISETDEAMNFEDELTLLTLRREKEMEDGEIIEEKSMKESEKADKEKEEERRRKKREKKDKSKETEKNKENIASENQVAWKKLSKSTKERSYRDKEKRSKSKEKLKKKKEIVKKKEKRKELPRYDVRKIVAERPSRPRKDEYGRDIREKSRQRSRSRSCSSKRSRSYSKVRSTSRSRTRIQRSWSRDRRSYSKSLSRRRSLSRGRRKSPKRRSTSRRRSSSRKRSVSRRRSRSVSRKRRSLSRRRSRRSVSRSRRSLSRSRQRRSVSRSRRSLSRSRDRRKDKKKYKSRSRSRNRKRLSRSKSPRKSSKSRERKHSKRKAPSRSRSKGRSCSRNWEQVEKIVEQDFSREREERRDSWSAQWTPSWSRSRSKTPQHVQQEPIASREWSPVLDNVAVPPKNLTVILTNKEAIKKKKKERRKESKKSKDEKKRKGKRNRTPPPSKEVFASGDNILVSVCFNKDNENVQTGVPELPETIPLIPPLKRRRREPLQADPPKRSKKEKTKDKRSKSPKPKKDKKKKSKAAEIAATKKPVAVIDLDQSPFREQTPSPRDVIVLSDDDDKQVQQITPDQCPPSQNSPQREQFVSQGPKTPPEPQIKFSINKQASNLRPSMLNPLLDEEEEEEEEEEEMDERVEEELEMRAQEELELRLKIGPNTPPEPPTSPPTSPDAYDPFDPTKSRSPTPDVSQEANSGDERRRSPRKLDSADGNILEEENIPSQVCQSQEKQVEKPKIISMVTIKRASPQRDDVIENESNKDTVASTGNLEAQQSQQNVQGQSNPFAVMNPVLATVAAAVQRSGVFNASNSNTGQRSLLQANRISPSNQQKQRSNDRSQVSAVFANSGKPSRGSKSGQAKSNGQNGNDAGTEVTDNVDMSSPYSPGSTLSDGIFDPPSPTNYNNSPGPGAGGGAGAVGSQATKNSASSKAAKSAEKKDVFDTLFSTLPPTKTATKPSRSKKPEKDKKKKPTNPKVGVRMDENQLQILDDLPSSAVEMQVKDKFLKKLNRQERVVEEVKLVLKPHYTKKHVTKEEYKDIMRKAVPKICHNKTGEINPKKIAHLIEAYVRKCRSSKKKTTESSSMKASKPAKILWS